MKSNINKLFDLKYEKIPEKFIWSKDYYLIGLTGTLAAGKSTISQIFKEHNCKVINADEVAKSMYLKPEIKKIIIDKFGKEIYDGTNKVNYQYLSKYIFSNKENVQWINNLIHPLVKEYLKEALRNSKMGEIVVYDVPLLFESNSHNENDYDLIIVVDAPLELRKKRAMNRNHWTEEEFLKREENQMSPEKKRELGDCIIWNDKEIEILKNKIEYLIKEIKKNKSI